MLQAYYAATVKATLQPDPALTAKYFAASAVTEDKENGSKTDSQPGDHSIGAFCSPQQPPGDITVGGATLNGDLATFAIVTSSIGGSDPVDGKVTVDLQSMKVTGWVCPY